MRHRLYERQRDGGAMDDEEADISHGVDGQDLTDDRERERVSCVRAREAEGVKALIIGGCAVAALGRPISVLTVLLAPVLLAVGSVYGVHVVGRYEEEAQSADTAGDAISRALRYLKDQGIIRLKTIADIEILDRDALEGMCE